MPMCGVPERARRGAILRDSVDVLSADLDTEAKRVKWLANARVAAILGGCSLSLPSVRSGCSCYLAFAEKVLGKLPARTLPPSVDDLLAWVKLFKLRQPRGVFFTVVCTGAP